MCKGNGEGGCHGSGDKQWEMWSINIQAQLAEFITCSSEERGQSGK